MRQATSRHSIFVPPFYENGCPRIEVHYDGPLTLDCEPAVTWLILEISGKRFAVGIEPPEAQRLKEALLKLEAGQA